MRKLKVNSPLDLFFDHMKDKINLLDCKTLKDVKREIDDYMGYYNNYRYQ